MSSRYPTPLYTHAGRGDFRDVHEPAEDSFLPIDALERDAELLQRMRWLGNKFVCNPEALFSLAFPDNQRPSLKADPDAILPPSEEDGLPPPSYEEEGPFLAEGGEQCVQGLTFPDSYPY